LGLEGDILFLEIVIFCLGGAAKLRWAEGRAAPRWACQRSQNDGCAQRTGAHALLKPTSLYIKALYLRYKYNESSTNCCSNHFLLCRSFYNILFIFLNVTLRASSIATTARFSLRTTDLKIISGLEGISMFFQSPETPLLPSTT
jgi:hypothetical protein